MLAPNLYTYTGFLNAFASFGLGFFILLTHPRSLAHRLWFLMSICVAGWAALFAIETIQDDLVGGLVVSRLEQAMAVCVPVLYLHFVMAFRGQSLSRWDTRVLAASYCATGLMVLLAPTPLFVKSIVFGQEEFDHRFYEVAGPLYWVFLALYVGCVTYALISLWRYARTTTSIRRAQCLSVFWAGVAGFLLGATCFPLVYGIPIPPVGFHGVWLYCLVMAYAIVQHQLLDIRVVIRKSVVYSLLITALTTGYFGAIYIVERVFQTRIGYSSLPISVIAFAVVALALQPLKVGIQRIVDLLIFHAPQQTVAKKLEVYEERAREGERYKAVATLAANIAHELKNPLAAIRTFLDFYPQKRADPAFQQQFHEVVNAEISRLQQVAEGLLDFSRPHAPNRQPVDLKRVLDDVLALTRAELEQKAIVAKTSYMHNGSLILGDASQLKQAFLNLVLNARDAMATGGTLALFTGAVDGHLDVHVADTGCGIHPKDLSHLFEPFFSKKANGNGLGLSIVRSIIREHHGTITVKSTPGHGTIFTIRLPVSAFP